MRSTGWTALFFLLALYLLGGQALAAEAPALPPELVRAAPEAAEQELNTWTLTSGCSSSSSRRACSALLWEPLSRADRVTTYTSSAP